jgi:hypothetical protein
MSNEIQAIAMALLFIAAGIMWQQAEREGAGLNHNAALFSRGISFLFVALGYIIFNAHR